MIVPPHRSYYGHHDNDKVTPLMAIIFTLGIIMAILWVSFMILGMLGFWS